MMMEGRIKKRAQLLDMYKNVPMVRLFTRCGRDQCFGLGCRKRKQSEILKGKKRKEAQAKKLETKEDWDGISAPVYHVRLKYCAALQSNELEALIAPSNIEHRCHG